MQFTNVSKKNIQINSNDKIYLLLPGESIYLDMLSMEEAFEIKKTLGKKIELTDACEPVEVDFNNLEQPKKQNDSISTLKDRFRNINLK